MKTCDEIRSHANAIMTDDSFIKFSDFFVFAFLWINFFLLLPIRTMYYQMSKYNQISGYKNLTLLLSTLSREAKSIFLHYWNVLGPGENMCNFCLVTPRAITFEILSRGGKKNFQTFIPFFFQ